MILKAQAPTISRLNPVDPMDAVNAMNARIFNASGSPESPMTTVTAVSPMTDALAGAKPNLKGIQAASPRRHWIDAHDAIPPLNKRVLCRHESGCFYVAECRPCATNAAGYYWHLNAIGVSPEVTHWRNI